LAICQIRLFDTFWHPLGMPLEQAVDVTWMERGFNAGQTHSSICPSIFNRLRAIYWSEIATFSWPLAFNAPVVVIPLDDHQIARPRYGVKISPKS